LRRFLILFIDVITGPSVKSLGAGAALGLATGKPKQLILVGRSKSKIQPVIEEIMSSNPDVEATFVEINLLDHSSVRTGADTIKGITGEIHGMINCAGIMAVEKYQESNDGIESQFATNHVSHFLLTNLLKDELANGKAVVVNVSSSGYELADINYDDVNFRGGMDYNSWIAYSQGKTANILFSVSLADKGRKYGIAAFAVNPGRKYIRFNIHIATLKYW
jgi:NAD(P)-dependent dehydrogenase (short-subunit alcohol dehydrogenase family)